MKRRDDQHLIATLYRTAREIVDKTRGVFAAHGQDARLHDGMGVVGEHHGARRTEIGRVLADRREHLEAGAGAQLEIDDGQLGAHLPEQRDGGRLAVGVADQVDTWNAGEHAGEQVEEDGVVLDDHDFQGRGLG